MPRDPDQFDIFVSNARKDNMPRGGNPMFVVPQADPPRRKIRNPKEGGHVSALRDHILAEHRKFSSRW
jgi:hypothetical protein